MKRKKILLILLLFSLLLTGCKTIQFNGDADYEGYVQSIHPSQKQFIIYIRDNLNQDQRESYSYDQESYVVVNITKVMNSTFLLNQDRDNIPYESIRVGDKIKVWIKGEYKEEKPVQVSTIFSSNEWMKLLNKHEAMIIQKLDDKPN